MRPAISVPVLVGVGDVRLALRLYDDWPVLDAKADLKVAIPANQRGAHMSRLQEACIAASRQSHQSSVDFAIELARLASTSQACSSATAEVRIDQQPPISSSVTGRASGLDVTTTLSIDHDGSRVSRLELSLTVQVMTACPCTIMYSRLASERESGRAYGPSMPPTFTHSQPGTLTVGVRTGGAAAISPAELLTALRSCAVLRESVLKRPDEHELVDRAHRRPQFAEDLVREAAATVAARLSADTAVFAVASLAESIHPHHAVASLHALAGDLQSKSP
ncbi:GTP cyclohydrolase, FolE2/MptA family [Nocardia rhizosphaerihabitans]|nr:GTP cyclohydrolase, FolE2/MptA family [Nocardia rhizosphaerihabitans]